MLGKEPVLAFSPRNLLGVGGATKLSAMELALPPADKALYGVQPFGQRDGRYFEVTSHDVLQRLGTQWIHTMVDSGTGAAQVVAIQDPTATRGPFLKVTTNAAQHDSNQFQFAIAKTAGSTSLTAYAPFVAKAGYDLSFFMRFQITSTVANAVFAAGLSIVDTTLLASSVIDTASFIGFYKAASATMGGVVRTGGTSTTTALTVGGTSGWTPTVSTMYEIGFRLQGRTSITYYVNGEATGSTTMTNLPANTVVLCPSFVLGAGTAAAATMEIEGAYWGQETR